MAYVITEPCVDVLDKSCIEECPVDCIYEGQRMQYIHPDECIDCGACESACPMEAIYYAEDLPADRRHYARINAEFFHVARTDDGHASRRDHDAVEELPPQVTGRPVDQ